MQRKRLAIIAAALGLLVGGGATALAGSPSQQQYDNPLTSETTTTSEGFGDQLPATYVRSAGKPVGRALPFTGFDAAAVAAAGFVLVLGGLGLRRLGRRQR